MWRCPETFDWKSISLGTPLPEQGVNSWDYFRRKLTISALRDEKKKANTLKNLKGRDPGNTRASFKTENTDIRNPFESHCDSTKSLSTICDNYTLWDRNQYYIDSSRGEVTSPAALTPTIRDFSGESCKNYFSVLQKWVLDRKNWEKREQSYRKRIRMTEEKISEQKALASIRLQELKSEKDESAESRDVEEKLESATSRIAKLHAELRTATDQTCALERRCNRYNRVDVEENSNSTIIAELQVEIGLAEEKLERARKDNDPELEEKLQLCEKRIREQNEKLNKLQLNCSDIERNLNFEKKKKAQLEETITNLTEVKITLKTEHQKFHLLKAELEALSSRKEIYETRDKELENAKLENIGLRKSNSVLTQRLDELEQKSYQLKQKLQLRATQQVPQMTCQSQTTNRRTPISVISSANQSTPISRGFESYGPYAMCPNRSVDPSITTISITPEQAQSESNNGRISEADVKFLKCLRVMMAKRELPLPEDSVNKPTLAARKEKAPAIVPKLRARSNAKTKRRSNRKGKVKKARVKLSCAPAIKSNLRKSGVSSLATRKAWCPA